MAKSLIIRDVQIHFPVDQISIFKIKTGGVCIRSTNISAVILDTPVEFDFIGSEIVAKFTMRSENRWIVSADFLTGSSGTGTYTFNGSEVNAFATEDFQVLGDLTFSQNPINFHVPKYLQSPNDSVVTIKPHDE